MTDKTDSGVKTAKKGNSVVTFPTFGHFPMTQWLEWEEACTVDLAGVRWSKAMHDHIKVQDILRHDIQAIEAGVPFGISADIEQVFEPNTFLLGRPVEILGELV